MFKRTKAILKKYLSLIRNLFWRKKLKPNPKTETEKSKSRVGKLYKIFFRRRIFSALILAVIIVSAGFLFVYAQDIIDSFTDSTKIADTWNTTVDTGAGNVKLKARSCDSATWDCTDNSVCSDTLGDGDYIIVAKTTAPTSMSWKNSNTSCVGPQCSTAAGNGNNLVADNTVNFANYPARDYCKSIGGRLPTKTELQCIYTNRVTFGDNFGTSYYWSAAEDVSTHAYYVNFSDGSTHYSTKTPSYSVRCVFGW